MALGDQAVRSMDPGKGGQLALTEVLVSDEVDDLIASSLNLPRFTKWKNGYVKRRLAQRQITHWKSIQPECPVAELVLYLESEDQALLIGRDCAEHAYFVAAHDSRVTFIASDVKTVDAAEHRAAAESLSPKLEAFAVDLAGRWFPEVTPALVIIECRDLITLERRARELAISHLQEITVPGGTHYLFVASDDQLHELELEMSHLRGLYSNWGARPVGTRAGEFMSVKRD